MKEAGTLNWIKPNTGGNNNSGFTGMPGGLRTNFGQFANVYSYGYWWTATEYDTDEAWDRNLNYDCGVLDRWHNIHKRCGFSVRCLRD